MRVAVIPARGGSKTIERKNILEFAGKPLLAWSIESALAANSIDKVIVSTEDNEISDVARAYGAEVHNRSPENAQDNVHAIHAVLECLSFYEGKGINISSIAMLLATSPLRRPEHIDEAMHLLAKSGCNSVVSVSEFDKPVSSIRRVNFSGYMEPIVSIDSFEVQRQDIKEPLYLVNGSIFVSTSGNLKQYRSFHKGLVKPYVMNKHLSVDINDQSDWKMAEAIACQ